MCYIRLMETIGIRELRQNASRHLERVKAGESITITDRGEPIAVISPLTSTDILRQRLITEGRLRPARRPLHLPVRRAPEGDVTSAEALTLDRADRL